MSQQSAETVLAIGPANYAGQAYYWAEAVRRFLHVDAFSFSHRAEPLPMVRARGFQFQVHRNLPHHRTTTPLLKSLSVQRLLRRSTHLALDGFLPLFDRLDRSHAGNDLDRLLGMGLQVGLIAHGSDVRDPDAHIARYPFSYYGLAPDAWVEAMRTQACINRHTAETAGLPVFVSTPDLLLDLPGATWLPLAIDPDAWDSEQAVLESATPTVVHVPSRRDPPIKGTAVIEPVLRQLDEDGRIHYVSPSGLSHSAMREVIRSADVVVDQILTGSYGATAVEGMAAGRLVVGFVGAEVRECMPEAPPIVDAEPARFADVMDQILYERDDFVAQASRGPNFVRRWHAGQASAAALTSFLGRGTAGD